MTRGSVLGGFLLILLVGTIICRYGVSSLAAFEELRRRGFVHERCVFIAGDVRQRLLSFRHWPGFLPQAGEGARGVAACM